MRRVPFFVTLAASLIAVASLLTLHLYRQGAREVLSHFQEQQSFLAAHLAAQIDGFFAARSRSLGLLSSVLSSEKKTDGMRMAIDYHARQIGNDYVKAIALYDGSMRLLYSTDGSMISAGRVDPALLPWARRAENRGRFLLKPATEGASSLTFVLATPVYRQQQGSTNPRATNEFVGLLAFVVDAEGFLKGQLGSKRTGIGLDRIWLIDTKGTLHFQPDRPDMVLKNAFREGKDCTSCHSSFSYLQEMLAKKEGVTEYQVKGEPRKIAGFAPISFENLPWIVVVTAPADRLTAFVWRSLRDHVFLLVVVLAMLMTGSYLIIRQEQTKTRAEEEILRWQEKNEERKRTEEDLKESENRLRHLSQQLITARETERKRISRELHDELGQALTVMKLHINYIKNRLGEEQVDVRAECEDAVDYVDQVIENVRRLSRDLTPTILEDFGLSTAIRSLAVNFGKRHGMALHLDLGDLDSFIPAPSHTYAYRIIQEALTNVAKHAHAKNISVVASEEEGAVRLAIEDDGGGFDMDEASGRGPGEKGLGLATMKAHAEMLGGTLTIRTEVGLGSRVVLTVPVGGR